MDILLIISEEQFLLLLSQLFLSLSLLAFDLNKHFLAPPSFAQYFICIPSLTLSYVDAVCA